MILADTSVVIAAQRSPTARILQVIQSNHAAICGVTVAEFLAGARGGQDLGHLNAILGVFQRIAISESIWPVLGINLSALLSQGITVPFTDALIATVAIESGLELWSYDAHFSMIQNVLPKLKLFSEPP